MYVKIVNGNPEIYSVQKLRRDNPDVSFPRTITADIIATYGLLPVTVLAKPDYNPLTHTLKASALYQVNGEWQQHYFPEALPVSLAEKLTSDARAEAYRIEADPLFFKAQRGDATQQEWLDKVAEIKARYP